MRKIILYISVFILASLFFAFSSCDKNDFPDNKTTKDSLAKGADVSWLTEMEASGKKFQNAGGSEMECMALLKSLGINSIRLRVWVNPSEGWNNSQDVLAKALRAKALGMRIMIDFHYSDTWADPGKQTKPVAWSSLSFTDLKSAMVKHTTNVLNILKNNDINIEWVQVGNEIGDGLLWEDGRASKNMSNFAILIGAGYDAVKSVFPSAKVIVHVHNGYDNALFRWIFDGLKNNGGKWDVIGMSLYPDPGNWEEKNSQCLVNMTDMVNRYGSEIMICEVGMSWDSSDESYNFLKDIIAKNRNLKDSKGLGIFYWEPECYGGWKNYTLGAFDNSGKPTKALDAFK